MLSSVQTARDNLARPPEPDYQPDEEMDVDFIRTRQTGDRLYSALPL
jgi:hypothetical protein